MSQERRLRMLSDGAHNQESITTRAAEWEIDNQPFTPLERYTQAYIEGVLAELAPSTDEEFAAPTGCPCASTL